jgi:thioredoxin reductase (NADPH)
MIDVVIIGAGPGGMTAGIYATRANLQTVMFDKGAPGGKMATTYEVDNWPGSGHISGPDLSMEMFNHTQSVGVEYRYGDIINIADQKTHKTLHLEDGSTVDAKTVIIASGMEPRRLNATHEEKFMVRGISFCAVCDGAFYKGKKVVVLGGGNSAMEESVYLTSLDIDVTIVHRREGLRADKFASDMAKANPRISWKLGYVLSEYMGDEYLEAVKIKNIETGEEEIINTDAVFMFIGHLPNTGFVKDLNITNEWGFIEANEKMETKIPGLFAIGDVIDKELRQIVTAAADGSIAAQNAVKFIESQKVLK